MSSEVHKAEIINIVNHELQDFQTKLQKNGCFSEVGCLKGKEHTNYLNGKLKSDLNDFVEFMKRQTKMNESILEKFEVAAKFAIEAATSSHASAKMAEDFKAEQKATVEEYKKSNNEVIDSMRKMNNKVLIGFIGAIVLMLAASLWGTFSKLKQDADNQVETATKIDGAQKGLEEVSKLLKELIKTR
jgi:hypothetical protein